MTGVTTWFVDRGDGVGVEKSPQAMSDFVNGVTVVSLGTFVGASLGASLFFAIDALSPQQTEASLAVMVATIPDLDW